jgi:hypothetical protein
MDNINNKKNNLVAFVKSHKYESVDALAIQKLNSCIDSILTNIYNNLCVITKAYPAKRITKKQFAIILYMMQKPKCNKMKGGSGQAGRTVLPMEYFKPDYAGNYSASNGQVQNAPMTLSRTALSPYMPIVNDMTSTNFLTGGGVALITSAEIKAFMETKKSSFTLNNEAINIIITIVKDNIETLLDDCKNPKVKKLTGNKIYSILKKKPQQYVHLSCVTSCTS